MLLLAICQISKITQSGQSFRSWLPNLDKKALTNVAINFTRNNLAGI